MQLFTNNGSTALANAVLVGDTTITVVDASKFPAGNFKVTLETIDRSVNEIVLVTGVVGNVLTVTRAQEGTVASGFDVGSKVEVRVTAEFLNDLQALVEGVVDDTAVATDKAYSSDKVMQLHTAQQEAIAHLSGASATFSSNVSQLVPEEPTAKVDIVWTNGQASSNASVLELGVNEVLFKVDGNYSFLTTLTLYRLSYGSVTTATFELYDADTGTVLKSISQAVDMTAGTKQTLPLNVLVPITGASEANPVRMKVRMGMTAANGTLELFSFSSVLTTQSVTGTDLIDDAVTSTTKTWSSDKISNELASLGSYTLEWSQTTFYTTQQATATITNFDSYTNYNVTALLGTVSIAGATITYITPAVAGNEVVSINGVAVASFEVLGAGILAPTINTPLTGSTDNSEVVTFDLSDFVVIPAGFDTHVSTTVEVYTDAGMTNLSATVTKTTGDLTLVDVGSHVVSTTYYARAKYNGNTLTSDWSATRSYTTKDTFTQAYGVDWNPTTDTYSRTGFAVGTANSTSYAGSIQTQMKRCVLNANGTVAYYLHPTNSTLKAGGTAATIDGSAGNVMVEIPKFYHKYENVGGVHKYSVSPIPEPGYTLHPAFIRGGVEKNFRYYPAYGGYNLGGKLISGSGRVPTVSQTRATFRGYAAANGTGWSLIDWNLLYAVQLLFLTEYATFDTQAVLGNGNDTGSDYAMTTGGSNGIGNGSSPATNDDTWMSYRGIENWYASMWKFIDGVNVQERVYFVNNNPATFADDVFTGDYVSTGITSVSVNGYVSNMSSSNKGFIPSEATGSSSTKVPDYFYQNTGNRIVVFGGSAGTGRVAGGFYLAANDDASFAAAYVGSGVSF